MYNADTQAPPEAGWWNVSYEGVMSFMPFYAHFDGKEWTKREFTDRTMHWYPGTRSDNNPTPFFD